MKYYCRFPQPAPVHGDPTNFRGDVLEEQPHKLENQSAADDKREQNYSVGPVLAESPLNGLTGHLEYLSTWLKRGA